MGKGKEEKREEWKGDEVTQKEKGEEQKMD